MATDVSMGVPPPPPGYSLDVPPPPEGYTLNGQPKGGDPSSGVWGFEKAIDPANVVPAVGGAINSTITTGLGYGMAKAFPRSTELAAQGINAVANSAPIQAIESGVNRAENAVDQFGQDHPAADVLMKSAGDTTKIAGAALPAEGVMEEAGAAATKSLADIAAQKAMGTQAGLKKLSGELYDTAAWQGGTFAPEHVSNEFAKQIENLKPKPIAGIVLTKENQALSNSLDDYAGLEGQNLTLDDVRNLDQSLTMKINNFIDKQTGMPDAHGRTLQALQNHLRDMADKAPNVPGNETLTAAKKGWAAQRFQQDLETIVERAHMTQNPGTALQNGYRNLYMDKARTRGQSDEVKELLRRAGTPHITDDALGVIGSRLNAVAAKAAGGLSSGVAAHLVGIAGRGAKERMIAGRGAKVSNAVSRDALKLMEIPPIPEPVADKPLMLSDRGDAARSEEARISALERFKEGRTGGRPIDKPQTGPMVGRPDGDVPYNFYGPNPPQRMLTHQPLVSSDMKTVIGSNWDKLDLAEQQRIQKQANDAWAAQEVPLGEIIEKAKQDALDLSAAKGKGLGIMQEALSKAPSRKNPSIADFLSGKEPQSLPEKMARNRRAK